MGETNPDPPSQDRRKRTLWLLSAGGASLLLPLAGLAYIHWTDTRPAPGAEGTADVFERREGQSPIVPSQAMPNPVAIAAVAGSTKPVSSLDFVKADPEFAARTSAAPAIASAAASPRIVAATPTSSSATAAATPTATKKTTSTGKKAFAMPKLQTGRGFMSFGSNSPAASGSAAGGSAQTTQQLLNNLPPGAQNNPDIQKYLQSQQGH
jgi:hypothetical protein